MEYVPVRLEKIDSNHKFLRTNIVEGISCVVPRVGECFYMLSEPIDLDKNVRVVQTSKIQSVEFSANVDSSGELADIEESPRCGYSYEFKTLNSTYRLTFL